MITKKRETHLSETEERKHTTLSFGSGIKAMSLPHDKESQPLAEPEGNTVERGRCVWQIRGSLCAFAQGRLTVTCRGASFCVRIQDHKDMFKNMAPRGEIQSLQVLPKHLS